MMLGRRKKSKEKDKYKKKFQGMEKEWTVGVSYVYFFLQFFLREGELKLIC